MLFRSHKDGRTATVSIRRVPSTGIVTLLTNGKVEGSLGPNWFSNAPPVPGPLGLDAPTQLFIPLLPLAHAPDAKRAAVIGLGSGIRTPASATALMATVERSRSGIASAVLNVSRQVGVAIGVAVFGALISGPLHLVDGMTVCLWIATCLTAVGAFVVGCAMPGAVAGEPSLPR